MATSVRSIGSVGLFSFLLAVGCSNNPGGSIIIGGSGGSGAATNPSGTGSTTGIPMGSGGNTSTIDPGKASQLALTCGNSSLDANEMCDDGNKDGGDGCTKLCQLEVEWTCPTLGQPCKSSAVCGDGKLASTELCDDQNTNPGDGCAADCRSVEPGWQCRVPGKRCVPLCGDGVMTGTENCDDGKPVSGDGCSSTCLMEPGFDCTGSPSVCKASDCGNGVKEAGEGCDAGEKNGLFYGDATGCSKTCTNEPNCRPGGTTQACTTTCGDGNRDANEACDDGNAMSGDGCSSDCTLVEGGFICADTPQKDTQACSAGGGECLVMPITYRDFDGQNQSTGHPDFFYLGATLAGGPKTICVPNASGRVQGLSGSCPGNDSTALCLGLVQDALGTTGPETGKPVANTTRAGGLTCACQFTDWDKTPVLTGVTAGTGVTLNTCGSGATQGVPSVVVSAVQVIQSVSSFNEWYADSTKSTKVVSKLELAQVGTSNQYQFSSSNGRGVYDDIHEIFLRQGQAVTGQPVPLNAAATLASGFFPLETTPRPKTCNLWPYWIAPATCLAQQWDARGWYGVQVTPPSPPSGFMIPNVQGVMRNFYFTSEVRYLFRYAGGETLQFFGDDDVWVYLNGKLVLDLGAPHERMRGSISLTATGSTATTDAQDVLTGAFLPVGTPQTKTGLGLEVGKIYEIAVFHADRHPRESNYQLTVSGFSTTRTSCKPRCGDGVITAGEECDDGDGKNADNAYGGCTLECKFGPFCGDSVINGTEVCDNGTQNGAPYNTVGGCTNGCERVHFCGDGIIDSAFTEECDGGTACTKECKAILIIY